MWPDHGCASTCASCAKIEEEEYTAGIINHFTKGLLKLPEGTTLRAYLAEKLNCDPMRITKKFTGKPSPATCPRGCVQRPRSRADAQCSDGLVVGDRWFLPGQACLPPS